MNNTEFVEKLLGVLKYKTCYAKGTFGQCAVDSVIDSKAKQYPEWYKTRKERLKALPDDTRLFDCVGLIKGVIWNFPNTIYTSNGLKDVNDQMIWDMADGKSTDFKSIMKGELLWIQSHVGVYIGDGKAIECTSAWENKVQITAVANIGSISGLKSRRWTGHAKVPTIVYNATEGSNSNDKPKDYKIIAQEIIDGKWGNGDARKAKLRSAGYTDDEIKKIQSLVNEMLKPAAPKPVTKEVWYTVKSGDIAGVIARKFGVSLDSIKKLNPNVKNWNLIFPGQKIRIK